MIQIAALIVALASVLIGIFVESPNDGVRYALATFAASSCICAILVEVQASKESAFIKRALERLIQTSQPSTLFTHGIAQLAVSEATKRGFKNCVVSYVDNGKAISIRLLPNDTVRSTGFMELQHEKLAEWSLLDATQLKQAVIDKMFETTALPGKNPLEHWNTLVDFIGSVARGLYPETVRGGHYAISARTDLVRIGVPYPPDVPACDAAHTIYMRLDDVEVPFLTFLEPQLRELSEVSQITASQLVSSWLEAAWGPPRQPNVG